MTTRSPAGREDVPTKASLWRQILGPCGRIRASTRQQPPPDGARAQPKRADAGITLTACAAASFDSCELGAANDSAASSSHQASAYGSTLQLTGKALAAAGPESTGDRASIHAVSNASIYCPSCLEAAVAQGHSCDATRSLLRAPSPTSTPTTRAACDVAAEPGYRGRMHVALGAYSVRDIAQCDPAMRIRNLKLLSYSPGSVVYKGTWQGLLVVVKFMLYRGGDPAGVQRRVSSLLAAHCMPLRSHLARVYACDMSEVVVDDGGGCGAAATQPHVLTVRPALYDDVDGGGDPCISPSASSGTAEQGSGSYGSARGVGATQYGSSRYGNNPRFHFSSVIFTEVANVGAGAIRSGDSSDGGPDPNHGRWAVQASYGGGGGADPGQLLQGLLNHLGARPGDYLLHCVSELAAAGNLWYGIRSCAYDMSGPQGPGLAARSMVHNGRGIAQGLQQLHAAGVVHGGLTPGNVLLLWSNARNVGEQGADGGAGGRAELHKRRGGFTARIADCGMRRLLLGPEWRLRLDEHPELRRCTAPELLSPSGAASSELDSAAAAATGGGDILWAPCHDVYSFGALLYCMCTGHLPGGSGAPAPVWPDVVWAPLRRLGDACLAADPAGRPTAKEIVRVLLVLEQRLRKGGGGGGRLSGRLHMPYMPRHDAAAAPRGAGTCAGPGSTAAFVRVSSEDAEAVGGGDGGGGGAAATAGIGLEQTAPPALSCRALAARTPPDSGSTHRFAMSSLPEVVLMRPYGATVTPPGPQ